MNRPKSKEEKDIYKLCKEHKIVIPWKTKYHDTWWSWAIAELTRLLNERDYYKKKYDEMRKVLG